MCKLHATEEMQAQSISQVLQSNTSSSNWIFCHSLLSRQGQPGMVETRADLHAGKVVSLHQPKRLASQRWIITPPYRACSASPCSKTKRQHKAIALGQHTRHRKCKHCKIKIALEEMLRVYVHIILPIDGCCASCGTEKLTRMQQM